MPTHAANRFVCIVLAINIIASPFASAQQDSGVPGSTPTTPTPQPASQGTGSTFNGPLSDYVPCIFSDDDEYQMRARNSEEKILDKRSANQLFNAANISIQTTLAKYAPNNPDFVDKVNSYLKDKEHGIYGDWLEGETPAGATIKIQNVLLEAINNARTSFQVRRSQDDIKNDQRQAAAAIRKAVEQAISNQTGIAPAPTDINDLILKGKQAILSFAGRNNLSLVYLQSVVAAYSSYFNDPANVRRNADFFAAATRESAVKASGQPYNGKSLNATQESSEKERLAPVLSQAVGSAIDRTIQQDNAKADNEAKISAAKQAINHSNYRQEYLNRVADKFDTRVKSPDSKVSPKDYGDAAEQAATSVDEDPVPDTQTSDRLIADLKDILNTKTSAAINQSQASAKPFQPPNDVSCSMAVMSWKETSDIFGRRVANTFVAIQVTLRNLNTKNEFLVHDIQVAVDTGMTQDYFGRFQAGRDKLLVRAVAQRGQSDDRRNRVLNTLQTVGAIAAASSLVGGTIEFKDAVAVFQGAFLTGFTNIFPDHTVEQLNHINDLVFSASNTSKVVVPVQGSVPLVTFISEKPIEQLPFAWCGRLPHKGINPEQFFGWGANRNCNFDGGKHNPGYVTPYRYSKNGKQQPDKNQHAAINGYPVGPSIVHGDAESNVSIEDGLPPWDDLKYKDWRGAAVRMLQEHTFVVIGGVHIQQIVTQPKVTNIDCTLLKSGQVDLSQTKDGMITCSITGSGLNLISAVTLVKGDSKIAGKIQPATDGNSATLTFKPDEMCDKEGTYSLTLTYKSDAQKNPTDLDSGESALLGKQPTVSSVSFADNKLTFNGACLDQLNSASLTPQVGDATVKGATPVPGTDGKNTTATSQFTIKTASEKTGLVAGAIYYLTYTSKIQPNTDINVKTLTVTIPQPTSSAPAVPTTPPKKSAPPAAPTHQ